jgi:hypothetical protein
MRYAGVIGPATMAARLVPCYVVIRHRRNPQAPAREWASVFEESAASDLLTRIADQRRALRESVAERDEAALARRPVSGKWSVLEHIRHLLFAEQAHLGRYVPGGQEWSPLGYTPQTMRAARDVSRGASASQPSLSTVLVAWDALHLTFAGALATQDSPAVRVALARNLKHLSAHAAIVERLLRVA